MPGHVMRSAGARRWPGRRIVVPSPKPPERGSVGPELAVGISDRTAWNTAAPAAAASFRPEITSPCGAPPGSSPRRAQPPPPRRRSSGASAGQPRAPPTCQVALSCTVQQRPERCGEARQESLDLGSPKRALHSIRPDLPASASSPHRAHRGRSAPASELGQDGHVDDIDKRGAQALRHVGHRAVGAHAPVSGPCRRPGAACGRGPAAGQRT